MPNNVSRYLSLTDTMLCRTTQKEAAARAYEVRYHKYWPKLIFATLKRLAFRRKNVHSVQELLATVYQPPTQIECARLFKADLDQGQKNRIADACLTTQTRNAFKVFFLSAVCKNDFAEMIKYKELVKRQGAVLVSLQGKCRPVALLSRKKKQSNKVSAEKLHITVSLLEKYFVKALKILPASDAAFLVSCCIASIFFKI